MITLPANEIMAEIHNNKERMPAFLNRDNLSLWLDNTINIADRMKLIDPVSNDFLDTFKINTIGEESEFDRVGQF